MSDRGVVTSSGREVVCTCSCHLGDCLHIEACCRPPVTAQGKEDLEQYNEDEFRSLLQRKAQNGNTEFGS